MSTVSPNTVVCVFNAEAGQWAAHFEFTPQVTFNGTVPMRAVRRLLEETGAEPASYPFQCESVRGVPDAAYRMVIWDAPNIALDVWPITGPNCKL